MGVNDRISLLSHALQTERDPKAALLRIASISASATAGAASAGISRLQPDGRVETVAVSDELATAADKVQYVTAQGPCLEAIRVRTPIDVRDLGAESRWPQFREGALALGVRSVASDPLMVGGRVVGSINIYSNEPQAFSADDRTAAGVIAAHASLILATLELVESSEAKVAQLHDALATRDVIGQAKGILIEREGCTAEEAFEMLKTASQTVNRKLRLVAADVVAEAEKGTRAGERS
jgi:GAF domain-containing protein